MAQNILSSLVVFLIFLAGASSVTTIPAGHVGVVDLFGAIEEEELKEGLHFINPFKRVTKVSVRTQQLFEKTDVPSKEGLSVGLEVSLLYKVNADKADFVIKNLGVRYEDVFIAPALKAAIRNVTVNHEAKELYTSTRELIANEVLKQVTDLITERGFVAEGVLLKRIVLPEQVQQAINNKLAAEQEAERMKFIILREEQEARRKRIEAQGIADFQTTVKTGIDDQFLKWKALEAVIELSKSPNTKFIILGDKSGLPILIQPEK